MSGSATKASSSSLFVRIPPKLYEAVKTYAEGRGQTLSRVTADLLTEALVSKELPGTLPHEVEAYMFGRRMFAIVTGLVDAANAAAAPDEEPADVR